MNTLLAKHSSSKLIQEQSPLQLDEEYVPCDIESLFTNVPITETIECILDEIYVNNKLPKLCSRLIFKRLSSETNH